MRFAWTSSNEAVARVTSTGIVEAVANGSATIRATESGGASGEAGVTVEQVVATLVLDPDTMTFLTRLDSRPIAVAAYDALGSYVPGVTIVWTSSDEDVAYISDGFVHSGYTGEAVLTATTPGGVSATARITVHQVVTHVTVSPHHVTFTLLGATQKLSASAYDVSLSDVFEVTFEWASSDESVATVTSDGLVEAVGSGTATITATESETGEYAEATITVEVGTLSALTAVTASVAPASPVRHPKAGESSRPATRLP
ncbi:MAG: Ig-like domain-containing protein [Gemmatimonadetes bacterium]|nr:Ig-like domain-containing protein [Gemmatimonadota bacterium]